MGSSTRCVKFVSLIFNLLCFALLCIALLYFPLHDCTLLYFNLLPTPIVKGLPGMPIASLESPYGLAFDKFCLSNGTLHNVQLLPSFVKRIPMTPLASQYIPALDKFCLSNLTPTPIVGAKVYLQYHLNQKSSALSILCLSRKKALWLHSRSKTV